MATNQEMGTDDELADQLLRNAVIQVINVRKQAFDLWASASIGVEERLDGVILVYVTKVSQCMDGPISVAFGDFRLYDEGAVAGVRSTLEQAREMGDDAVPIVLNMSIPGIPERNCTFSVRASAESDAELGLPLLLLTRACWKCWAYGDEAALRSCTGCRLAKYCGEECQNADWKRHKGECGIKKNG